MSKVCVIKNKCVTLQAKENITIITIKTKSYGNEEVFYICGVAGCDDASNG